MSKLKQIFNFQKQLQNKLYKITLPVYNAEIAAKYSKFDEGFAYV